MNARRDVEQLLSDWLVEDAPSRAPDRILAVAGERLDDIRQRRLPPWRSTPMRTSRVLAAAAIIGLILLVSGAAWLYRGSTNDLGVGAPSLPTPTSSPGSTAPSSPPAAFFDSVPATLAGTWVGDLPAGTEWPAGTYLLQLANDATLTGPDGVSHALGRVASSRRGLLRFGPSEWGDCIGLYAFTVAEAIPPPTLTLIEESDVCAQRSAALDGVLWTKAEIEYERRRRAVPASD